MDFLLVTIGSHGDVHPFVGIGRALRARGHRVRVAVNPAFETLVRNAGLDFLPLGAATDFETVRGDPDLWHPRRGAAVILREMGRTLPGVYDCVAGAAGPGTTVVGSTLSIGARVASEKLGLPMATVHLSPICIRSSQSMPLLPGLPDMNRLPRFCGASSGTGPTDGLSSRRLRRR